jgi:hypothetical protein
VTKPLLLAAITLFVALSSVWPQPGANGNADWQVSGTVRDHSGEPVKGLWVRMAGPGAPRPLQTDSDGRFTFRGRAPGMYSIRVQPPDDGTEPRSRTLRLLPGQTVKDFDLRMPRGAVVSGRVTDRSGRPVSGAVVVAYIRSYEFGHLRLFEQSGAITDDRGNYRIANLPDGIYVVAATPLGRKPLRVTQRRAEAPKALAPVYPPAVFAPSGRELGAASAIEIREQGERHGVDIVVERNPAHCLFFEPRTAAASAAGARPLVRVSEWLGTLGPLVAEGEAGPHSQAQICGLPAGEYQVEVIALDGRSNRASGYTRVNAALDRGHHDMGAITAAPSVALLGKVEIKGAQPGSVLPQGMYVSLSLRNRRLVPGDSLYAPVEADGTFSVPGVLADNYGFSIHNLPPLHFVARLAQAGRDIGQDGVRPENGLVDVVIDPEGARLSGVVMSDDREPVPVADATVVLIHSRTGEVQLTQSGQSGEYSFDAGVAPGEYKAAAVRDLPESQRRDGRIASGSASQPVELDLGARGSVTANLTARKRQ